MSLFTEWNSLLLEEYFSPEKAGQDVWIPTTRIELEGIGVHKGGANGLIEAVKQGPSWLHVSGHIAKKAKQLARQRLSPTKRPYGYLDPNGNQDIFQGSNAPTYLPYIALWVLAVSEAGESGFYAKVRDLINDSFPNNTGQEMEAVWNDLAYWSTGQQQGRFGRFKVNVLGEHRFVGMAYAQAMVTYKDIDGINRLFGSCRLLPGQTLSNGEFSQILEYGLRSNYLSAGLKDAMGKLSYRDHLKQFLSAYLEFWDGYVPKRLSYSSGTLTDQIVTSLDDNDELSIILRIKNLKETLCWEIGWRLPAIVTGVNYAIKVDDDYETKAKLELAGTHIHSISSVSQAKAWCALNKSASQNVESTLFYTGSDGERNERQINLRQSKIRVLVSDKPDPSLDDSFIEREMPLAGAVYLLYSHVEYSSLERYLLNEKIEHQPVSSEDITGLPDQWGLIYINCTKNLTAEQRASIVDEEPVAFAKARIRLVGGKPVIGAGSKKYAYYDLPIIELEAPTGAVLVSAGLSFEELFNAEKGCVRRFQYTLNDGGGSSFQIKALLDDDVLCTAGLQVLTAGGGGSSKYRPNFSIDKFGRPLPDASGLRGAIIGDNLIDDIELAIDYFQPDEKVFLNRNGSIIWEFMESNISAQFLDSIAATINGSMTYGVARDQIRRLANNIGINDIEPALLIRDLRCRGHVEIETDAKGHMVRVCAVPATIYSLPIKDFEQRQLYGICGSISLPQWKKLTQAADIRFFVKSNSSHYFPVVYIVPYEDTTIKFIQEFAKFLAVDLPIKTLSQWLGSVKEIKENLNWYPEQGFRPNYLERLNPGRGMFNAATNVLVNSSRKCDFFRYEDPQIKGMRVYKLGVTYGDGFSKYSFIQDSRWGVWMAMSAFAELVSGQPYMIADASPWPLHYDSLTGCLWIPARMEPPFSIERVLALCAGDAPMVIQVTSEMGDDSILLLEKNQRLIGNVSRVYSDMANGKWLCYQSVPRVIASKVAYLLGGELKDMGCRTIFTNAEDKKCQLV
jgi:hypothetical protein